MSRNRVRRRKKLLKGLIDLWDALAAARKPLDRARQSLAEQLDGLALPPLSERLVSKHRPRWKFWASEGSETSSLTNRDAEAWRERVAGVRAKALDALDGVIAGYRMGQERATRLLELAGYVALEPAGERFDPEWMEAADLVAVEGRPPGEVAEVVRRGYRRAGVVVRPPQVAVTR
jgi:hypothetical protein